MKRSTDRILTSHAGSLPRPAALIEANVARLEPGGLDPSVFDQRLRDAVRDVVRKQSDVGIDVVNDGEFGKAMRGTIDYGAWASYAFERLGGWEPGPPGAASPLTRRRERAAFPGAYAEIATTNISSNYSVGQPRFTGPITYTGAERVSADIENLKAALSGAPDAEAFITAVAPGSFGRRLNEYYASDEEYLYALAEALRQEYLAIVEGGFVLQLDDPGLPDTWDLFDPEPSLDEYKKYAQVTIDALNHALRGIPGDRIRYHICWGSWHGPHTTDLPLEDIAGVLLQVNAGAYSIEAGNVRHEHEWRVWQDARLPEGKLLIPGVVSHATNVVEHPQVVADRLVRYASAVGRENVIAGTDCGLGGRIHEEIAWTKLQSLVRGAELASKELW